MRFIRGFFSFWYDFIIGDDWKIAASVVVAMVIAGGLMAAGLDDGLVTVLGSLLILVAFTITLFIDQAGARRKVE